MATFGYLGLFGCSGTLIVTGTAVDGGVWVGDLGNGRGGFVPPDGGFHVRLVETSSHLELFDSALGTLLDAAGDPTVTLGPLVVRVADGPESLVAVTRVVGGDSIVELYRRNGDRVCQMHPSTPESLVAVGWTREGLVAVLERGQSVEVSSELLLFDRHCTEVGRLAVPGGVRASTAMARGDLLLGVSGDGQCVAHDLVGETVASIPLCGETSNFSFLPDGGIAVASLDGKGTRVDVRDASLAVTASELVQVRLVGPFLVQSTR